MSDIAADRPTLGNPGPTATPVGRGDHFLLQVGRCRSQDRWVVLELAETDVAVKAEQAPHGSIAAAVIDVERVTPPARRTAADGTKTVLPLEQMGVLRRLKPIDRAERVRLKALSVPLVISMTLTE
jgi:hypothetical protein